MPILRVQIFLKNITVRSYINRTITFVDLSKKQLLQRDLRIVQTNPTAITNNISKKIKNDKKSKTKTVKRQKQ